MVYFTLCDGAGESSDLKSSGSCIRRFLLQYLDKRIDETGIELCAPALFEFPYRPFFAYVLPIGPGRGHGVIGVSHGRDPRIDADLLPRQSPRILKLAACIKETGVEKKPSTFGCI